MSNSSLSIDPRLIPLVRSLKEQNEKSGDNILKKGPQDISSEKTSENSTKLNKVIENKKAIIENEKNKNDEKEKPKRQKSLNRLNSKANTMIKKNANAKISIDGGGLEPKTKSGTSEYHRGPSQSSNKIQIISKEKEQSHTIHLLNTLQLTSGQSKTKKWQ